MTSPRPPWWQDPQPPTDPGGFPGPTRVAQQPRRVRWGWVLAALFVVLAVLLAVVLNQLRRPAPGESAAPAPAGPAQPTPTLPVVFGGFHYTVGISTFTSALEGPGTGSAAPGRHFLVAMLAVRNDQQDRPAPALVDSSGAAPAVEVGLTPVTSLPPEHAINRVATVSDCDNDPSNISNRVNHPPVFHALPAQTCTVATNVSPEHPVSSFEDDSTMPPGAVTYAIVRTIDVPDDVPTPQVGAWVATSVAGTIGRTYYVYDPITPSP